MFKNSRNDNRARSLTCSGVFIINFEHAVFHTFILLFLLTLGSPFLSPSSQFSPVVYYPFFSPCSHLIPLKKPVGFLMFSGGSKGSIGQKRVKFLTLILLHNGCSFNCWKNICNMFCTTFFTEFENLTLCPVIISTLHNSSWLINGVFKIPHLQCSKLPLKNDSKKIICSTIVVAIYHVWSHLVKI